MGGGGSSGSTAYGPEEANWGVYIMTGKGYSNDSIPYVQGVTAVTPTGGFLYYLNQAIQNNVYAGINAYDPDTDISTITTRYDEYENYVDDLDSDSYIEDLVATQDRVSRPEYNRSYNQLTGVMSEINAVNSSAFAVAVALMESNRLGDLNKYRQDLRRESRNNKLQHTQASTALLFEIMKAKIVAKVEEHLTDIDFNLKEASWQMAQYGEFGKLIASFHGGVPVNGKEPNKIASALAGGLAGASAGNAIAPGPGTAIGAVVGGLAGLLQ